VSRSSTPLRAARFVVVTLLVAGGPVLMAGSGQAAARPAARPAAGLLSLRPVAVGGAEQITGYSVDLMLKQDGAMHVQETIKYDFGSIGHHGIKREIPVEFAFDEKHNREYPIDNIEVSSPSGAPDDKNVTDGPVTTIQIGDPDNDDVTGPQTYVISYDMKGVVNSFSDHQELYWNAIGDEWQVPIASATVSVEGPAAVQKVACFEGAQGSTDTCTGSIAADGAASFLGSQLQPRQGMTVVASFPVGTFPNAAPILKERQTLARAFSLTPLTALGSLALLGLLGGGAVGLVLRRGRDERYLGITPGLEPGLDQEHTVSRVPWLRRDPIAVQFTPPEGMRPGQLGTLIDEHANVVDVTATIVDLAVRGFLKIEEIEQPGMFRSGDWKLVELDKPVDELHDYEIKLYNSIFRSRNEVLLSDLKQTFKSDLESVQSMLYADVTSAGWFEGNPSSVRARWAGYGLFLSVIGGGLTWLLGVRTSYGLFGVAVLVSGILLLALSPRMPSRTAKGTALLAQAKGFRLYLEKAEANQIKFEEGEDIFSRYLPFAIVFGVAERWARVFATLAASGAAVGVPTWYVGSLYANGLFNYAAFGGSMDNFATTTSGSIAAATPSSSGSSGFGGGGFSGGGGGGGGGGSW
jgi:uncharacterized membrane protein YgcG